MSILLPFKKNTSQPYFFKYFAISYTIASVTFWENIQELRATLYKDFCIEFLLYRVKFEFFCQMRLAFVGRCGEC